MMLLKDKLGNWLVKYCGQWFITGTRDIGEAIDYALNEVMLKKAFNLN